MKHVLHIGRHQLPAERIAALRQLYGDDVSIVSVDAGDRHRIVEALASTRWTAVCAGGVDEDIRKEVDRFPRLEPRFTQTRSSRHAIPGGTNRKFSHYEEMAPIQV